MANTELRQRPPLLIMGMLQHAREKQQNLYRIEHVVRLSGGDVVDRVLLIFSKQRTPDGAMLELMMAGFPIERLCGSSGAPAFGLPRE